MELRKFNRWLKELPTELTVAQAHKLIDGAFQSDPKCPHAASIVMASQLFLSHSWMTG